MAKPQVLYDGKDVFSGICPVPFVFFEKEYIENSVAVSGVASRFNITIEGQITGRPASAIARTDLENKKENLIKNFSEDFKTLTIKEASNEQTINNCIIDSIDFEQSKYYGILPFSISISAYDSGSFFSGARIINPKDSWNFSEESDGTLTLKHSVSADGLSLMSGSSLDLAIKNAKNWVTGRLGISKKIQPLRIKNIDVSGFVLDSISESIDRFAGKYSVEENYKADLIGTGYGILRYAVDLSSDLENGTTSVTVDGSVFGKPASSGLSGSIGRGDISLLRSRATSFLTGRAFSVANDAYSAFKTGYNPSGALNGLPFSQNFTESPSNSEISFSVVFDDNPIPPGVARCVYSVDLSEDRIRNIVDIKLNAEIDCERGDKLIRWNAVSGYYYNTGKFDPFSLAMQEYNREGYTRPVSSNPKTESISINQFDAKISYSANWSNRCMPYPDTLSAISEKVEFKPSVNVYAVQPSLFNEGEHNIQSFSNAKRSSVSISIDATALPNKTTGDARNCVNQELVRIRNNYIGNKEFLTDEFVESYNASLKTYSLSASYSFEGPIVN